MLLVKSKELKSLNKKPFRTMIYALFCTFLSAFSVSAQTTSSPQTLSNPTSVLSIFLSLLLVVAIIFALAWLMRRFNVTQAGNGQMRMVASMMAGSKERVMVVQVGEQQYLLGVTSNQINHLATLDKPLSVDKSKSGQNALQPNSDGFQAKLVAAMADRMNPKKKAQSAPNAISNNDTSGE